MWWRSVYLKTVREGRVAALGWGFGMGLLVFAVAVTVDSVIGAAGAQQAMADLTQSFRWAGDPVAVTTVGGYTTWKLGFTILVMAVWPLIAASRVLRGAEERGSLDVLLSVPRGRLRIALESVAALWTTLLAMSLITAGITYLAGVIAHADYGLAGALLFGLNLALICGVFGSIALLISQFTLQARVAAGAAGGLLFFFIVLDALHRVLPGTTWLSALSPVYYYNLSKPLIPSFGTDPWAMLLLLAISVVLSAVAIAIFVRRDVGRTVRLRGRVPAAPHAGAPVPKGHVTPALPAASWSLRSVYARGLATVAAPTLWWTLAIAGFTAFAMLVTEQASGQIEGLIEDSPVFSAVIANLGGGGDGIIEALLSALFVFLPLLIMIFAVTQASRWGADEDEGRQELILATPQPRRQVILARFAAVATGGLFIGLVTLIVATVIAGAVGLSLPPGHLAAAVLSIVPQFLLMAAIGYLFATWLAPALESGLLSVLLAAWFFISFIGPELGWSEAVMRLSPFHYYGTPLQSGLPLANMLIVLAVAAVALVLATVTFARKDIGRR